jgi:hypothetical protein
MKQYRTIYTVLTLVGGAAMILMDVRLTNQVLFPSSLTNDRESVDLVELHLDRQVTSSSISSISGIKRILINRSNLSLQNANGAFVEHVRIAGIGNSTTPNHSTAQPAEDAIIERAEAAPVLDTRVHETQNTSEAIAKARTASNN